MARTIARIIIPDSHGAHIDKKAEAAFLKDIKFIVPDEIVWLGDHLDCGGTFSSHQKTYTNEMVESYSDDSNAANSLIDSVTLAAPKATQEYLEGNHEQRVEKWAVNTFQNKKDADSLLEKYGPEKVLDLKRRGIKYYKRSEHYMGLSIPGTIRKGKCFFTHGIGAGQFATYQHLKKFGDNVVHGHCLPLNYEVATRRGWVSLGSITDDDIVLSFHERSIVESPILEIVRYRHSGNFASIDAANIRQTMTHLHRLAFYDGTQMPILDALSSGKRLGEIPYRANPLATVVGANNYDPDWLRLIVAYCADGHKDIHQNSVRWHLKKERKQKRLEQILHNLNENVSWSNISKTGTRKTKGLSRYIQQKLISEVPGKKLPIWFTNLNSELTRVIIDEIVEWDGTKTEYGFQYHSHKEEEIDIIQLMLARLGLFSSKRTSRTGIQWSETSKPIERETPLSQLVVWLDGVADVGCITTIYGNFIIRDPYGKVQLSGNTHRSQAFVERTVTSSGYGAWCPGTLAKLQPLYMHSAPTAWTHGYGLQFVSSSGKFLHFNIPIMNGESLLLETINTINSIRKYNK